MAQAAKRELIDVFEWVREGKRKQDVLDDELQRTFGAKCVYVGKSGSVVTHFALKSETQCLCYMSAHYIMLPYLSPINE